jgi:dTDP-4-amino-4,6-dideoxygalactose transaminase
LAEITREKGTNRSQFFRGQVDKYTWTDIGSSYLPGEIIAAFIYAQMEEGHTITDRRMELWHEYDKGLAALKQSTRIRLPWIPEGCRHNAHMYYLLLPTLGARTSFINELASASIQCVFHYVPLHSSPAGRRYGRVSRELPVTDDVADRLVPLPLWLGMEDKSAEIIARIVENAIEN